MNQKKLYSVKDICEQYGITRKTLFYYDRIDLLKPTERQGKQQFKYYDDIALTRLNSILEYRDAGLSIDEIRQIIDLNDKKEILQILHNVKSRLIQEEKKKQEEMEKLDELIRLNS